MFVDWVQKLASQDWAAFQSGSVFPLIAVARQEVWTSLVSECRSIVDQYEHEYARRIYWTTEPIVAEEDPRGHTIYKLRVVEKG